MKLFLFSALVASSAAAEVQASFSDLYKTSTVIYNKVDCGDWADYICCSSEENCKLLTEGGADKKTQNKNIKERKKYCVHKLETCCGSDLTYNWEKKHVDHDHEAKKNVKGCKSDEVCVAPDVFKHSRSAPVAGDHDTDYKWAVKALIGKKTKSSCMKTTKVEKLGPKYNKKYTKKVSKEESNAAKEFVDMTRINSLQDHDLQCGDFDKSVFKCCSPDKNFCDQISAEEKDKWCVHKKDSCCSNFQYSPSDRSNIKLEIDDTDDKTWAMHTACKKDSTEKTCVYHTHDAVENKVTTKCVENKLSKKNKKRGGIKKNKKDKKGNIFDLLSELQGGDDTQFPF